MWSIGQLWRYPTKSMLGEQVDSVTLGENGVAGDRAYALLDVATGRIVSAKRPAHFGRLLDCRATTAAGGGPSEAMVTLPDGSVLRMDDPETERRLTALLGREVRVVTTAPDVATYEMMFPDVEGAAPEEFAAMTDIAERDAEGPVSAVAVGLFAPGTFVDVSPLHVVAASTLAQLAGLDPSTVWDVRRFRPNIVIDGESAEPFVENGWMGCEVAIGDEVVLQMGPSTPRCVMTTLAQPGLERDLSVLRTLAQRNRQEIPEYGRWACLGTYASVERGGTVRVGDRVEVGAPVG
ncbi:MAG TPA: MOSC domain-containing protein [Candidatus Dormibacteraeota bacterium]|jgi:hypothetical protein